MLPSRLPALLRRDLEIHIAGPLHLKTRSLKLLMSKDKVMVGQVRTDVLVKRRNLVWRGHMGEGQGYWRRRSSRRVYSIGVSGKQGTRRLSCNHTGLEEARRSSPLEAWEEAGPAYAWNSDAWPPEVWEEAGIV